jgi:crotonobetainyl-CoA:carnitine CoA-transferase CaiB-like acyl-CoA transferase
MRTQRTSAAERAAGPAALAGVRVIDFGRYIAGPWCGALLADLGADVIRVERPDGAEDRPVQPVTPDGVGAMYLQCNRNKRSLTLDPATPQGREVVARLVAGADVVIANLPPDTLHHLGLDYETLRAIKADIILTTVNAFGSGGEWSRKVGFDGLAQAASGNLYLSGPEGQPSRAFVPYVDFSTATLAALATVAALRHRDLTGEGQLIEGALLRTALTWNSGALIEQDLLGIDRVSTHNRGQTSGPADTFACKDGWVMCLVIGAYQFDRWAKMVGHPELVTDDRFLTDEARGDNGSALSAVMAGWCAVRTVAECLAEMEQHKVPGGPVLSPRQVLAEPHVGQIGVFERHPHPGVDGGVPLARFPVELSATPGVIRHPAPTLGEHSDEVLTSLGYSEAEIAALRRSGAV